MYHSQIHLAFAYLHLGFLAPLGKNGFRNVIAIAFHLVDSRFFLRACDPARRV
jgi:hypothetical protein